MRLIWCFIAGVLLPFPLMAQERVDLELVLALDASASVSAVNSLKSNSVINRLKKWASKAATAIQPSFAR